MSLHYPGPRRVKRRLRKLLNAMIRVFFSKYLKFNNGDLSVLKLKSNSPGKPTCPIFYFRYYKGAALLIQPVCNSNCNINPWFCLGNPLCPAMHCLDTHRSKLFHHDRVNTFEENCRGYSSAQKALRASVTIQ